jgi:hypothetical protein
MEQRIYSIKKKKNKAIPLIGRGDLQGCKILRIQHCLDNRLTDGSKVVNPAHRPRSTPQKHYFLLLVLISISSYFSVLLEGLGQWKKKFNDLIGTRTFDLPACMIVHQPSTLLYARYSYNL